MKYKVTMSTIRLDITHMGLGLELRELAFQTTTTLRIMKDKLYPKTGTETANMVLTLVDPASGSRTVILGDDLTLDSLGLVTGSRLELCDSNDASVSNNLFAEDAKPVPKVEAKADSGFAKFRKQQQAAAGAVQPPSEGKPSEEKSISSGREEEI